jgi:hypothetical protein
MTIKCPNCATSISNDVALCPECGCEIAVDASAVKNEMATPSGKSVPPIWYRTPAAIYIWIGGLGMVFIIAALQRTLASFFCGLTLYFVVATVAIWKAPRSPKRTIDLVLLLLLMATLICLSGFFTCCAVISKD